VRSDEYIERNRLSIQLMDTFWLVSWQTNCFD